MAEEIQQQVATPILYSFYGKQYDYNDLAKAADQGLSDYLNTLKRGSKDSEEFRTAYNDIMSGIKDGTITFADGSFHDSQGRYTNSDEKYRDYYGLIANYIYNQMGKSNEYKAPEDSTKIKWSNNSVRTALMRQLFNSDTARVQDFLDLDEEKDGVRGITNRASYLSNALQRVADNWDSTFQGYQDSDKTRYVELLTKAAQALHDGTIDPGDYLALGNAIGGVDFRELMATGTPKQQIVEQQPTTKTTEQVVEQPKLKHTVLTVKNPVAAQKAAALMQRIPTQGLINILKNSFYNQKYTFGNDSRIYSIFKTNKITNRFGVTATLNALYAQGKLQLADPSNPNLYYIPGLRTKRGTGWVWDKANNTVTEMMLQNIPYAAQRLQQVAVNKRGGILKASSGAQLPWYSGITDYNPTGYKTAYGSTLYGINNNGVYERAYDNSGAGSIDSRYKTDSDYSDYGEKGKWYATEVEKQNYFKNFTKALQDAADIYQNAQDKSTLNDSNNLFLRWAHAVDKSLPSGSTATFFDNNGALRTSWGATNNDSYGRAAGPATSKLSDYIYKVRNDQLLSNRHNDLLLEGSRYFYTDSQGNKHWVDPEVAKKYRIGNGVERIEGNTRWTDFEIFGNQTPQGASTNSPQGGNTSSLQGTNINPKKEINKQSWIEKNGERLLEKAAPLALSTTRLFDSLHTNNKVADIMKKATTPVLKNTYELYSPVTGAFSEMQLRENQAADVRRFGNQPYTSDASLNAARSLDANRQATDLERQGFIADDNEIKRTKAEALARQENNIARRTEVANVNRAAINASDKEKAYIEAERLNKNWQSRDNYLGGIESDIKQRIAQKEANREYNRKRKLSIEESGFSADLDYEKQVLQNKFLDLENEIKLDLQNKIQEFTKGEDKYYYDQPFYKEAMEKLRQLRDQKLKEEHELTKRHSILTSDYIKGLYDKMDSSSLFRKGGSLKMINKILNK